jgi:hypothetical protein
MSEPVVVLVHPWPIWFRNALASMPRERRDAYQQRRYIQEWWLARYDAQLGTLEQLTLTFPNRETYMQCVLTWS